MSSSFPRDKLPKIDVYALILLSSEESGTIDSIFPPESFQGDFLSFSSFKDSNEPLFLLEQFSFPVYPQNIRFKNQPIGIFIDKNPSLLRALDKRTKVFYSQDPHKEPTQKEADYFSNLREKELKEKLKEPSFLKTEYTPYYSYLSLQRKKDRLSIIFEKKSEKFFIIWVPCPIYSFWEEMLKNFLKDNYPECKIELKSTYYQLKTINTSFLALILIQLAERGLFYKKNIYLEVNIKGLNHKPIKASLKSYQEREFNKFIFHEISIKVPYSIRWEKEKILRSIKSFFLDSLNLPKVSISLSYIPNHPLFMTSLEEILYPLNDLLQQHTLKYFDSIDLSCYEHFFKGERKELNRFKEKNDYRRRRFSYEQQGSFPYYKLISSSKKGIGLSISYFSEVKNLIEKTNWTWEIKENEYLLKYPYFPVYSSTLKIALGNITQRKRITLNPFSFSNMVISFPLLRESIDLAVSEHLENKKNSLFEKKDKVMKPIAGCCIEIKSEPWISQIEITNFDILLCKGKKEFLKEEKDRVIAIAQDFFERQIPENITLIKDWEKVVNLTILEEGTGSFSYFPYALRNAFYSALLQTGINSYPSLYLK